MSACSDDARSGKRGGHYLSHSGDARPSTYRRDIGKVLADLTHLYGARLRTRAKPFHKCLFQSGRGFVEERHIDDPVSICRCATRQLGEFVHFIELGICDLQSLLSPWCEGQL